MIVRVLDQGAATEEEPRRITWRRVELEDEILSILGASPEPGERIEFAFRRREHELMLVFARLSVLDARELHRRLSLCLAEDPIGNRIRSARFRSVAASCMPCGATGPGRVPARGW